MLIPTGLCLALLSVAHCASTQNDAPAEPKKHHCQELPPNTMVFPGTGIKANYRPYYLRTYGPDRSPLELHSSSGDQCTPNLPGTGMTRYTVFQVSPTFVYLSAYDTRNEVFSVDMGTCAYYDVMEKLHGGRGNWTYSTIFYADGFDEIFEENNTVIRKSFGATGYRIGQPRAFHLDSAHHHQVLPTLPNSRTSNLIVVGYKRASTDAEVDKIFVNLVDADGRLIKNLLTFPYDRKLELPMVHDISNSMYTFCYHRTSDYECAQFDQSGNEVYRKSVFYMIPETGEKISNQLISVHNLKEGPGFALFAARYKLTSEPLPDEVADSATFTSMAIASVRGSLHRPARSIVYENELENKQYHPVIVSNYDEVRGRFTVQEGFYKTKKICWNTFSLSAKHE